MLAGHQLEHRLLLRRVERQAGGLHPGEEALQQDVRVGRRLGREQIGEGGHRRGHPSSGSAGVTGAAGAGCRGPLSTLRFTLERTDGLARAGVLHTRRGDVPTPVFMPVATHAAFRHVGVDEAGEAGRAILLGNTYHLMLRPGPRGVRAASAASTASWAGTAACSPTRAASRSSRSPRTGRSPSAGAHFRSFHDNSRQLLSPESSIAMQQAHRLGHHDGARRRASTRPRTRAGARGDGAHAPLGGAQPRGGAGARHRAGAVRHRPGRLPPRAARPRAPSSSPGTRSTASPSAGSRSARTKPHRDAMTARVARRCCPRTGRAT